MNNHLSRLEEEAITFIRNAEKLALRMDERGFHVAFSGGKDSQVMLALVEMAGVKHHAEMQVTSVDPPNLMRFVRKYYPQVKLNLPKLNMRQLIIKKKMLPTRIARFCCAELKEQAGAGCVTCIGIRAAESTKRAKTLDWEHRTRIAEHAQQFIEESEPLTWAWKMIHSEYKRKNPDLLPDWVMFIAQADLVCAMFAALMRYARHFDAMITAKAGRKLHTILPDEIRRMQGLIPEYMGGMPHTRIRRLVDAALLKDFLTQPLSDEPEN